MHIEAAGAGLGEDPEVDDEGGHVDDQGNHQEAHESTNELLAGSTFF